MKVVLQDPSMKQYLDLGEEEEEERQIYAGDKMKELADEMSWGEKNMWTEGLVITSAQPTAVEDVENDIERELAFYRQALDAAFEGIQRFESEGLSWKRPDDYLAEMVKSDAHMLKVKEQLVHETQVIEEAEQRRKERENKKYSKQVAAERRKDRAQQKKHAIESVSNLRKSRAQNNFQGDLDLDAVGLGSMKSRRNQNNPGERFSAKAKSSKRKHKDAKYGFGGPKRKLKQNDAYSSAGGDGPKRSKPKQRPGKSRRAAMRRS